MRLLETSEAFLLQKKILSYCLFAPPIYIVFLHAHPVRGESHNYPNATGCNNVQWPNNVSFLFIEACTGWKCFSFEKIFNHPGADSFFRFFMHCIHNCSCL